VTVTNQTINLKIKTKQENQIPPHQPVTCVASGTRAGETKVLLGTRLSTCYHISVCRAGMCQDLSSDGEMGGCQTPKMGSPGWDAC